MAKKESKEKDAHKGTLIGAHFSDEQIEKIERIAQVYDNTFGDVGRNRARALRWLVDCFDESWLNNFPAKPVMQSGQPTKSEPPDPAAATRQAKRNELLTPIAKETLPVPTDEEQARFEAIKRERLAAAQAELARRASGK